MLLFVQKNLENLKLMKIKFVWVQQLYFACVWGKKRFSVFPWKAGLLYTVCCTFSWLCTNTISPEHEEQQHQNEYKINIAHDEQKNPYRQIICIHTVCKMCRNTRTHMEHGALDTQATGGCYLQTTAAVKRPQSKIITKKTERYPVSENQWTTKKMYKQT